MRFAFAAKKKCHALAGILSLFLLAGLLAPVPAAEEVRAWRFASLGSMRIRYRDEGGGEGAPLVFIHGWACDSSVWNRQIPFFAPNHRVIAVDLPGFGGSDKPQDIEYTLALFADAVGAVVDAAGIEHPVLVGHSMGYGVAARFIRKHPEVARALVNVDGAVMRFPTDPDEREELLRGIQETVALLTGPDRLKVMEQFLESVFYGKTAPDIREEVSALMLGTDAYATANSMRNFLDPRWWSEQVFDLPSLALYAENPRESPDLPEFLKSLFPRLDFRMWDDTGHFLMMERPERFNKAVAEYLETLR